MVSKAVELWGRLDILVNNAFSTKEPDGSAVDLSEEAWDYAMNVLVKSMFLGAKYAVPEIQKSGKGSIINISSVHGLLMAPKKLVYEAGKSSVIGVTRQMAIDFGPMGIRVNAICPGHIVTERIEDIGNRIPRCYVSLRHNIRFAVLDARLTLLTLSTSSVRTKRLSSQDTHCQWMVDSPFNFKRISA